MRKTRVPFVRTRASKSMSSSFPARWWPVTMWREEQQVPVGHRDAPVGGGGDGGGDAGHLLKGDAVLGQQLQFLPAPAEQETLR